MQLCNRAQGLSFFSSVKCRVRSHGIAVSALLEELVVLHVLTSSHGGFHSMTLITCSMADKTCYIVLEAVG